MNPKISQLITYISSQIKERGGYPTKTKLLKLLYLFDIAYYIKHQETFTGFDWVFLHFGPWANEYDSVLDEAEGAGLISRNRVDRAEYINSQKSIEIEGLISGSADELSLRRVLDRWAEEPLNRLLDYVYFNTEPMIHGTRYQHLDFSTIPAESPKSYKRTRSGRSEKEISELRQILQARLVETRKQSPLGRISEPIQYDDIFYDGLRAFEEDL